MTFDINGVSAQTFLLSIGGILLSVLVLSALHKRLKLFTKGSVAFMISVLMIVTIESVIEHLNDRRNAQFEAQQSANMQVGDNFLRAWFEHRSHDDIVQWVDNTSRMFIDQRLTTFSTGVAHATGLGDTAPDASTWTAVSYDIKRANWNRDRFEFTVLIDTNTENFIVARGRLLIMDTMPPSVMDLTFERAETTPKNQLHWYYENATYRNPAYETIANESRAANAPRIRSKPAKPKK